MIEVKKKPVSGGEQGEKISTKTSRKLLNNGKIGKRKDHEREPWRRKIRLNRVTGVKRQAKRQRGKSVPPNDGKEKISSKRKNEKKRKNTKTQK